MFFLKKAVIRQQYSQKGADPFIGLAYAFSLIIIAFILFPLTEMVLQPSFSSLKETLNDKDVIRAIQISLASSGTAALLSQVFGTPFSYLLARRDFIGKKIIESVIDLPIMIPHPVVGIAILSISGCNHWLGRIIQQMGIEIMGTFIGLTAVLTFVGLPFYVNTVKAAFEAVPERFEKVSRSLGASSFQTFFRITFPLVWRNIIVGMIMCMARAISEFGAVVIVAYHPMTAPVMIYERFTAYGLKYSQPVAVWLIFVCLVLFLLLRLFFTSNEEREMIRLHNLSVHLPAFSLQNINLTVEKGEFFTLLGPTGSGKTLLLESMAGLVRLSDGAVEIQGRNVTRLPPEKRGVSIVYQDHALFPHMTVRRNIFYGLRFHKQKQTDKEGRTDFLARRLGIDHLLDRFPRHLSGGERQRTALARALAVEPDILLLDEPLSSLDPNFREDIRLMIKKLHRETGVTVLLVTHDFTEAHFLSQRAAILHSGCIEQAGSVQRYFISLPRRLQQILSA